jgi:hypothetical protein
MPPRAARRTRPRPTPTPRGRSFYWEAILHQPPPRRVSDITVWVKHVYEPPDFKVATIQGGNVVTENQCHLSRGAKKYAPDMVCWTNKDLVDHVVQFLNARWPFDPALNTNNEKILVPALGTSAWYQISPGSGAPGLSVSYEYGVDVPPGPPGPGVISDD